MTSDLFRWRVHFSLDHKFVCFQKKIVFLNVLLFLEGFFFWQGDGVCFVFVFELCFLFLRRVFFVFFLGWEIRGFCQEGCFLEVFFFLRGVFFGRVVSFFGGVSFS